MKKLFLILILQVSIFDCPAWAGQGWYLMVPPPASADNLRIFSFSEEREFLAGEFDITVPLPKWVQLNSFDTAKDCEENRKSKTNFWKGDIGEGPEETKTREHIEARIRQHIEASRCISSDDPRLK